MIVSPRDDGWRQIYRIGEKAVAWTREVTGREKGRENTLLTVWGEHAS